MIDKNGIRALSDESYDYYELLQDFGILNRGAIFVHDNDDKIYGSLTQGCLKLCWTPKGDCYDGLCANSVFLHFNFTKDKTFFKKINLYKNQSINKRIESLEDEIRKLKKELSSQ